MSAPKRNRGGRQRKVPQSINDVLPQELRDTAAQANAVQLPPLNEPNVFVPSGFETPAPAPFPSIDQSVDSPLAFSNPDFLDMMIDAALEKPEQSAKPVKPVPSTPPPPASKVASGAPKKPQVIGKNPKKVVLKMKPLPGPKEPRKRFHYPFSRYGRRTFGFPHFTNRVVVNQKMFGNDLFGVLVGSVLESLEQDLSAPRFWELRDLIQVLARIAREGRDNYVAPEPGEVVSLEDESEDGVVD